MKQYLVTGRREYSDEDTAMVITASDRYTACEVFIVEIVDNPTDLLRPCNAEFTRWDCDGVYYYVCAIVEGENMRILFND